VSAEIRVVSDDRDRIAIDAVIAQARNANGLTRDEWRRPHVRLHRAFEFEIEMAGWFVH